MNQRLCKDCIDWYSQVTGVIPPDRHCHHDEQPKKEQLGQSYYHCKKPKTRRIKGWAKPVGLGHGESDFWDFYCLDPLIDKNSFKKAILEVEE